MSNMLESLQLNIAFFPVITTIKSSTFFILLFMDQVITQRNIRTISNYLCWAGIVFEAFHHEPVLTCEEGKKFAQNAGAHCCKSLLLRNKKRFFLFFIPPDDRFSAKEASEFLGCGHLSFAAEEELAELLGTFRGAVCLLGLIFDKEHKVELILDEKILNCDFINCHPCTNDQSWKISMKEITDHLLPSLGYSYRVFKKSDPLA